MNPNEDLDLRQEFARLRQEEVATLPTFARTLGAARRKADDRIQPRRWGLVLAAPLAAAAALTLWLLGSAQSPQTTRPTEVALSTSLESWGMPTDYLLDAPGTYLLDTIPELGDTDSYDTAPID